MEPETGQPPAGPSGLKAGLAIGAGILGLVLVLSWFGDGVTPVDEDAWRRLVSRGAVSRVELTGERATAELALDPGRVRDPGVTVEPTRVLLPRPASAISETEREQWRKAGIEVVLHSDTGNEPQPTKGLFVLAGLLAVGAWYLWDQIRLDRTGAGGPRRRMATLELELKEGRVTPEDYRRRADEIATEM